MLRSSEAILEHAVVNVKEVLFQTRWKEGREGWKDSSVVRTALQFPAPTPGRVTTLTPAPKRSNVPGL